jgi:hypothetical protein
VFLMVYSGMSQEIANSVMRDAELDTEMPDLMEETSLLRGDDKAGAKEPSKSERAPKAEPSLADGRAGDVVSHRRKRDDTLVEGLFLQPRRIRAAAKLGEVWACGTAFRTLLHLC